MTARWRTLLRIRALLRLLLDAHVPIGALYRCVEQVKGIDDAHLPNEQRVHSSTRTGSLALDIVNELLGDDVELIDRDGQPELRPPRDVLQAARDLLQLWLRQLHKAAPVNATEDGNRITPVILTLDVLLRGDDLPPPRPPGEPRDLLRIADELRRRIALRKHQTEFGSLDEPAAYVHDELVDLLGFVLPLQGAPLPDLERFGAFLESERFYNAMQAYRHASLVPQGEVAAAFEAVKAALLEAVRR